MTDEVDPENLPDYRALKVPDDKPAHEYNHHERRAEILQLVEEKGVPEALNYTRLANRYDVVNAVITKDMKRIRSYILHNRDEEKAAAFTETAFNKCIRELMEQGDYDAATRALERYNSWLAEEKVREPEPDKQEIEHSGGIELKNATVEYIDDEEA